MDPIVKPRSLKRKPRTRIPEFNEWKSEWEITHALPVPMGNPYGAQPLTYALRVKAHRIRGEGKKIDSRFVREASEAGFRAPSRRVVLKTLGRTAARLHPIGMAANLASDVKTIYDFIR